MAEMPTSKWRLALLALLAVSLACSDPLTVPQPSHVESVERVRPVSVPVNSAAEVIPNVIREAAAKRGGSVRALALGRVTTRELPDGRELQLQYVGGEDHQPRMLAVFLEGKLQVLNHIRYERQGQRSIPAGFSAIHYNDAGQISTTSQHSLSEVLSRLPEKSGLDSASNLSPSSLTGCESQIIPTPECEQAACFAERAAVAGAFVLFTSAELALGVALAGCAVGATCPAVIAAYATLTGAALALSAAQMVLEDCLSSSSGGGGDPGGGLPNCTTYIIEVSYDNGVTWEYLDTVTVCE